MVNKTIAGLMAALLICSCALAEPVEILGTVAATNVVVTPEPSASAKPTAKASAGATAAASAAPSHAPAASASPTAAAEPTATPTPAPTETPRLYGLSIGIDPGHQARANSEKEPVAPNSKEKKAKVSSGTSGVRTGIAEYATDLEIALKLRDALEALGCSVYMTRDTNEIDISNLERAEMMNELGVDLVLRLHCDGSTDKSAHGTGMFVRKNGEKQEESEAAAKVLLEAMCEATGAKARGVFLRDTYTMNNWATVPCILVEMGFMSNPEEDEKLNAPEYQELLVQGMVEGICRYFER